MDEKKEMKYAEGIEVEINKVSIESNPNESTEIKKITFETNKGNITWKPKVYKERLVSGIVVKDKIPMSIEKMPEKLKKLGSMVHEKGTVIMNVCYTIMNTEMDGEPKTYRFITSEVAFNKWIVVGDKVKEEVIE